MSSADFYLNQEKNYIDKKAKEYKPVFNPANATDSGDTMAGLKSGILGLKQTGAGAGVVLGQTLGIDSMAKRGAENYASIGSEMEKYNKNRPTSLEDINGVGSAVDYAQYQIGNVLPSAAQSVLFAAVGSLYGSAVPGVGTAAGAGAGFFAKGLAKKALEKKIAEYVAQGAAKDLAEHQAKKAIDKAVYAGVGMFGSSYIEGLSSIGQETMDENGKVNKLSTFIGSVPHAALDAVVDMTILGRILKGSEGEKALVRYAKSIGSGATMEGTQEALQEANDILAGVSSGKEYSSSEVISRLGNSFVAAGIAGGAAGVLGGRKAGTATQPEIVPGGKEMSVTTTPAVNENQKALSVLEVKAPSISGLLETSKTTPITLDQISAIPEKDVKMLGIGLQLIKESNLGIDTKAIDQSLATIKSTGLEIPAIRTVAPVVAPKEAIVEKAPQKSESFFRGGRPFDKKSVNAFGVSITSDPETAEFYIGGNKLGDNIKNGTVQEMVLSPNTKFFDPNNLPSRLLEKYKTDVLSAKEEIALYLKYEKPEFDAIDFRKLGDESHNEIRVINPEVLQVKTKSTQKTSETKKAIAPEKKQDKKDSVTEPVYADRTTFRGNYSSVPVTKEKKKSFTPEQLKKIKSGFIERNKRKFNDGASVSFADIVNGETLGLKDEVYTVVSSYKSDDGKTKIELIDNEGKTLWTTAGSIELVKPTEKTQKEKVSEAPNKSKQAKKAVKKEVVEKKVIEKKPAPTKAKKPLKALSPAEVASKIIAKKPLKDLPILGEFKVSGGYMLSTDLEITVRVKTDLTDGMYRVVGEDAVRTESDANDFPEHPVIKGETIASFDNAEFSAILKKANRSIDTAAVRPELGTIHIKTGKNGVIASTDSYRLYMQPLSGKVEQELMMAKTEKLLAIMPALGENITISSSDGKIKIAGDNGEAIVRNMQGQYPAFERIIPAYGSQISFNKKDMVAALKAIAPYAKDKAKKVNPKLKEKDQVWMIDVQYLPETEKITISVGTDKMVSVSAKKSVVLTKSSEINPGTLVMPIRADKDELEPGVSRFNIKYIADAISNVDGDTVFFYQSKETPSTKPQFFTDTKIKQVEKKSEKKSFNFSKGLFRSTTSEKSAKKLISLIDEEVNPNIRAFLSYKIFEKIVKNGLNQTDTSSEIMGQFDRRTMSIDVARNMPASEFVKTLRHEVRHAAFYMMSGADQYNVVDWYKRLTRKELEKIYGSAERLDDYLETYKGKDQDILMADETANQSFDEPFIQKIYNAVLDKIHKILMFINKKFESNRLRHMQVKALYKDVFKQTGGQKFAKGEEFYQKKIKRGAKPRTVTPGGIKVIGDEKTSTSYSIGKGKVVTDKRNISAKAAFNELWKQVYGKPAPDTIAELMGDKSVLFNKGVYLSFAEGKKTQKEFDKDKTEFQKQASMYVEKYIPKEIRGEFTDKIMNVTTVKKFDDLIASIQPALDAYEKKNGIDQMAAMVKRLKAEYRVREKIQKMSYEFAKSKIETRIKNQDNIYYLKKEFRSKLKSLQQKKDIAVEYITMNLPKAERGIFLNRVAKVKTSKGLDKIFAMVDVRRNNYERRKLVESIEKIMGKIHLLPAEIQKDIIAVMNRIDLHNRTIPFMEKIRDNKNLYDSINGDFQSNASRKVLEDLNILNKIPFSQISTEQLMMINQRLQQISIIGRYEIAHKKEMREKTIEAKLEILKAGSVNLDKLTEKERRDTKIGTRKLTRKGRALLKFNSIREWLKRLNYNEIGTDRVVSILDGGNIDMTGPNAVLIMNPVDDAVGAAIDRTDRFKLGFKKVMESLSKEVFAELYKKAGTTNMSEITSEKNWAKNAVYFYKALKQQERISHNIAVYALSQQKDVRDKLIRDNLIDVADIDAIQEEVMSSPGQKMMYDFMRSELDKIQPELSKAFTKMNPTETLGFVENFFPNRTDYSVTEDTDQQDVVRGASVNFASLKERKRGGKQILSLEGFKDFQNYMESAIYYIETSEAIGEASSIVSNEEYKKAVGTVGQSFMKDWLRITARRGGVLRPSTTFERVLDGFRRNMGPAVLGISPNTIAMQTTASLNGASAIGGTYQTKGSQLMFDERWRTFMKEYSQQMRNRAGGDVLWEDLSNVEMIKKLQEITMKGIQVADYGPAGATWMGAYTKKMDEMGMKATPDSFNAEAGRYADRMVRLTQGTAQFHKAPQVLFNENRSYWRAWHTFETFMLSNWSQISVDVPQTWRKDKALGAKKAAFLAMQTMTTAGISYIGLNALIISSLFGGEDDRERDYTKSLIATIVGNVPHANKLFSILRYNNSPIVFDNFVANMINDLYMSVNGEKESTRTKHQIKLFAHTLQAATGLPPNFIVNMLLKANE